MGKRFYKQTIHDVDLRGRTVLVRADYNVPLTADGTISDNLRIRASLPTLQYLLEQQCKIVVISHLGRPKGREAKYSLAPVAEHLAELLGRPVRFVDDCVGDKVRQMVKRMPSGVIVLENLRFYAEEEANDETFARAIARATGADYFIQDGFGVVHRAHASTDALALCIPGVAGDLLTREYVTITEAMRAPKRPLVAVIGGAKVSDKIELIHRLIDQADTILIGGAMANAFLQYRGHVIGKSVTEPGQTAVLRKIYQAAARKVGAAKIDELLVLPTDVAVAPNVDSQTRREVTVDAIGPEDMALDIGSQAIERFTAVIAGAKTVIWNGPMGYASQEVFSIGSARVALAIAQNKKVTSIVGGGDTADFVLKWDGHDGASFTHTSTGGGASMELMAGKKLPGIERLLDAHGL
ncbi:MAG: phosphoglycerate kinase [Candidatus Saccharibacteria bacterium]|nr:phosphoglycerate kinase [Candidatus Saccharibacteria bacterium]